MLHKVSETRLLVTTGPESCGKTTLASGLSAALQVPLVHEVAREYLTAKYRMDPLYQYNERDLLAIARMQHAAEQNALATNPQLLVCDTDLLVLIVWSEVRYGVADPWILDTFHQSQLQHRRTYLLCDYHIPWQHDPLREHRDSRDELFARYQAKLQQWQLPHNVIAGSERERMALALSGS